MVEVMITAGVHFLGDKIVAGILRRDCYDRPVPQMKTFLFAVPLTFAYVAPVVAQKPTPPDPKTTPTILAATVPVSAVPPGKPVRITYHWEALPMGKEYQIFVHAKDAKNALVFQDDHQPPYPATTANWQGRIDYVRGVNVPANLPDGTYRLEAGAYDPKTGRVPLLAGSGVKTNFDLSYDIGTLTVDAKAPAPRLDSDRPATLNLAGYHLTFDDEFNGPLDVSATGPGTKWIAHTPSFTDFGDAAFANPDPGSTPFSVKDGVLTIEARRQEGKWTSGLLSSVDPKGNGFSQQYGYFEMRAKFPEGAGTWPAFWLLSQPSLVDKKRDGVEIDIVEQYGVADNLLHTTFHWWFVDKPHAAVADTFNVADMTRDFHRYGFLWDERQMVWYFDGVEVWRQPTPPEAKAPMYVLVNLALGGGWPIDKTPSPSRMLVDYVRVYGR